MANKYQQILDFLKAGKNGIVYAIRFPGKEMGSVEDLSQGFDVAMELPEEKRNAILLGGEPVLEKHGKQELFLEPFYQKERLIILGGGHVAVPLVKLAKMTGFYVVVADDREEFANVERFPEADEVLCGTFPECIDKVKPTASDYVVIITRGHSEDTTCIQTLCKYEEPFYTGLIGSRKRTSIVFKNLEKEGYDAERIHRICTPIGLDIGAKTIEEIDIAIMAEIIKRRRQGTEDSQSTAYIDRADHDEYVIAELAKTNRPCVAATIMKVEGSAPRGAGARMIIYGDGTLFGSIGGGCVEHMVIHMAQSMVGSGRYQILRVNLDGKSAMAEGMVCGGRIQVLLEDVRL
jgi:xanthine dehydrogenase accessory factor